MVLVNPHPSSPGASNMEIKAPAVEHRNMAGHVAQQVWFVQADTSDFSKLRWTIPLCNSSLTTLVSGTTQAIKIIHRSGEEQHLPTNQALWSSVNICTNQSEQINRELHRGANATDAHQCLASSTGANCWWPGWPLPPRSLIAETWLIRSLCSLSFKDSQRYTV